MQRALREHGHQNQHEEDPDDIEKFNQLGRRIREQRELLKTDWPAETISKALKRLRRCGHKIELRVYDDSDGSHQGPIERGMGFDAFYDRSGTHPDTE